MMTDCENLTEAEVAILAAIRPFIGHAITTELCEELLTAILSVGRPHSKGQQSVEVRFADASPSSAANVVPEIDGGRFDEWSLSDFAGQCRMQARDQLDPEFSRFMAALAKRLSQPSPALEQHVAAWKDVSNAPKDGTILRLLVNPDRNEFTAFDDSLTPFETIGFNNLENTEEDRWEFAGWDWSQDCFITGRGEVIGWMQFGSNPAPVSREAS